MSLHGYDSRKSISANFHTTPYQNEVKGLQEFFDDAENWGKMEVKVGRSWRKDELRIKSNEDLHKLWYVLLKEKNMLLTMEYECKRQYQIFPNPERIDKVEESMANLEQVVRERNRAYMLLETGETGERPTGPAIDWFGREVNEPYEEHTIPDVEHERVWDNPALQFPIRTQFSRLLREKEKRHKLAVIRKQEKEVARIFRHFPDASIEAVKMKFPDVNVEKVRRSKEARGNHENVV